MSRSWNEDQDIIVCIIWHNDSLLLVDSCINELNETKSQVSKKEHASFWFPFLKFNPNQSTAEQVEQFLEVPKTLDLNIYSIFFL
jgi:hypothetical protein